MAVQRKEAYYFSHDANARHDEKILELRFEFGWEGYGLYWALIECLREATDYKYCLKKLNGLALHLSTTKDTLEKIINNFSLFENDGECFWSESLYRRMETKKELSEIRRNSIQKRWDNSKSNTNELQNEYKSNTNELQSDTIKEKESKVNESESKIKPKKTKEEKTNTNFEIFFKEYPRKDGRVLAQKSWEKLKMDEVLFNKIINAVKILKTTDQWIKDNQKFVPMASTFINQKRWEDEIKPESAKQSNEPKIIGHTWQGPVFQQ